MISSAKPTYITFIVDKLNNGIVDPKHIVSEFCIKFQKTERTFWNQWKIAKLKWETLHEAKEKLKEDAILQNDLNLFKSGLKSKEERQLQLQNKINELDEILLKGTTPDTIFDNKAMISVDVIRSLTAIERANLMKVQREITAELNKMGGDYAPAKSEVKVVGEQPLFNV